jgi:hypothetical protein
MAPRCRSALSTSAKSKSTGRRPARRHGIQPRRCQAWTVAGLTWRRSASCVAVKYSFIEVPSELQTDSRYMSSYSGICARSSVTESGFRPVSTGILLLRKLRLFWPRDCSISSAQEVATLRTDLLIPGVAQRSYTSTRTTPAKKPMSTS